MPATQPATEQAKSNTAQARVLGYWLMVSIVLVSGNYIILIRYLDPWGYVTVPCFEQLPT